jgi:hypothetical protein
MKLRQIQCALLGRSGSDDREDSADKCVEPVTREWVGIGVKSWRRPAWIGLLNCGFRRGGRRSRPCGGRFRTGRRRGPRRRMSPRTPCRSPCTGRWQIRSKGWRTRDSRGVPSRRIPARAARRLPARRASSRGSPACDRHSQPLSRPGREVKPKPRTGDPGDGLR